MRWQCISPFCVEGDKTVWSREDGSRMGCFWDDLENFYEVFTAYNVLDCFWCVKKIWRCTYSHKFFVPCRIFNFLRRSNWTSFFNTIYWSKIRDCFGWFSYSQNCILRISYVDLEDTWCLFLRKIFALSNALRMESFRRGIPPKNELILPREFLSFNMCVWMFSERRI